MPSSHRPISIDRRGFMGLMGVAGLAYAASSCAGPGSTSNGGGAAPTGGSATDTISFAHWRAEDKQVFDTIIAGFVEANADAGVKQDISPSNDYQSSALQRLRGGEVGDAFTAFRGAQFEDMVVRRPLRRAERPGLRLGLQRPLAPGGQTGRQAVRPALPGGLPMPIANVDLFEKAGVTELPQDWDGFLALCEKLKSAGVTPIAWPGGDAGNAGQLFNSMVMNNAPSDDIGAKIEAGRVQVHRRLVPQDPEPVRRARAVLPAERHRQRARAAAAAVRRAEGRACSPPAATTSPPSGRWARSSRWTSSRRSPRRPRRRATRACTTRPSSSASTAPPRSRRPPSPGSSTSPTRRSPATYANGTAQHVTVDGRRVHQPRPQALEPWLTKKTALAPRFQFLDLDVEAAVEAACVAVVGGQSPEQAAEEAQKIVDEQIG